MFRYTGEKKYLKTAENCADHFISALPQDLVPYWDLKHPSIPDTYRDASAASIAACALWRLSHQVRNKKKSLLYHNIAVGLFNQLTEEYLAEEEGYRCLLLHSVGNYPAGSEIDCNITYADYYYLEAFLDLTGKHDFEITLR